jgi:hypothetical protein
MVKVKKHKRKGHKRVKDGKVEYVKPATVSEHTRKDPKPSLNKSKKKEIKKGKAKNLMNEKTNARQYYCWDCGKKHYYTSDKGKLHLQKIDLYEVPHTNSFNKEELVAKEDEFLVRQLGNINEEIKNDIYEDERLKLLRLKKDYEEAIREKRRQGEFDEERCWWGIEWREWNKIDRRTR